MADWHDTMVDRPETDAGVYVPAWPCSGPSLRFGCSGSSRNDFARLLPRAQKASDFIDGCGGRTRDRTLDLSRVKAGGVAYYGIDLFIRRSPRCRRSWPGPL